MCIYIYVCACVCRYTYKKHIIYIHCTYSLRITYVQYISNMHLSGIAFLAAAWKEFLHFDAKGTNLAAA